MRLINRLSPAARFKKHTEDILRGPDSIDGRIVYTGIVTQVDLLGSVNPLYSCRIDLDGFPRKHDIHEQEWYEPLMPINFMRIPERFEKVHVTFQNTKELQVGYWFSRMAETTTAAQKVRAVDGSAMEDHYNFKGLP